MKAVKIYVARQPTRPSPIKNCINLSSPLLAIGRCKYCGKAPSIYYSSKSATRWRDPRNAQNLFQQYKKYCRRLSYDFYLREDPKEFIGIWHLIHEPKFKSYNPRIHKNINILPAEIREFLTCECKRTTWAFSEIANEIRPEISHRKSRYKYPASFEDWN